MQNALEQLQHLEQKYPAKDGKAGKRAAVDDTVARELGVRLHLLCHGKARYGTGRRKDRDERDELDAAKAECDGTGEYDGRYEDKTRSDRKDELGQMCVIAAAVK